VPVPAGRAEGLQRPALTHDHHEHPVWRPALPRAQSAEAGSHAARMKDAGEMASNFASLAIDGSDALRGDSPPGGPPRSSRSVPTGTVADNACVVGSVHSAITCNLKFTGLTQHLGQI
jgi:hypothetical protein